MMAAASRTQSTNAFALELEGVVVGFLRSFEGGHVTAEVIQEPTGPSYFAKKHIGPPRYEPIVLEFGLSMGPPIRDWIQGFLSMNYQRKNGAIILADFNYKAVSKIEFFNALITEITFPASDGSSKEAAYLTVKIQPEMTRTQKASGKISGKIDTKQKQWLASNFRLKLDGLDTTKVTKINAFSIKQTSVQDDIGDSRDYLKEPGRLEFPNLTVTLGVAHAQTWLDWANSFIEKGNNDDTQEKSGSIAYLSANRQADLLTLELTNVGIFSLKPSKSGAGSETLKTLTAELYCERMTLDLGKAVGSI